ncbi:proline--tRNA ligase [Richelia intracellularis]|uniref:proline--tRNA ligase n=1 Tax=Richelia intracellularis TaxID=1164990 RepID=UPI000346B401|nr:proline--tRNA ligase [Richelia intracellularis]
MRLSQMLLVTLRNEPSDAEIPSHKLLIKAGYIHRIGSGIYTYLPLMWRVIQKIAQIVREEMNITGAQECLLPQLQPANLWKESGRWDAYTKAEGIMFTLTDRKKYDLALGPTHEEVITTVARDIICSYRQLPICLYQIQTKFRDEIRPRFGLMRGREFVMKDAYSFHANQESLKASYQNMHVAYSNILRRIGMAFQSVQADSGSIGGSGSQEFMILAETGEDEVLYTEDGKYAANLEKAISLPVNAETSTFTNCGKQKTPSADTVEKLCNLLKCSPTQVLKNVLYEITYNNETTVLVLVSIRGDQQVNDIKLQNELTKIAPQYRAKTIILMKKTDAESQVKWAAKSLPLGYIAPDLEDNYIDSRKQVNSKFLRLIDKTAIDLKDFITGANEPGYHILGANWGEQFKRPIAVVDLRKAKKGDYAVHDPHQTLQSARGIEVGHIFQLGIKYSQVMKATYTNQEGKEEPLWMGCYGIGVSRLAQAAVEQSNDKDGIIWPVAIAPYHVIICIPNMNNDKQVETAEKLYIELNKAGIETLIDDRKERAGVKFKDADLLGIPYRIITGKSLVNNKVELVKRENKEAYEFAIQEVVVVLKNWIREALD